MVTAHNIFSAMPLVASRPPASEDRSTAFSKAPPAESPSTLTSSPEQTRAFLFQIVTASGSQLSVSRLEPGAETVAENKGILFKAKGEENQINLEWVARGRDDGYYLWRSEEERDGAYKQITNFLLPAFDMDRSEQGLKFEYADASVVPGVTYFYKREAMDVTGKSHFVARVSATPPIMSKPDKPKKENQNKENEKEIGPSRPIEKGAVKENEKVDPTGSQAGEESEK